MRQLSKLHWPNVVCYPCVIVVYNVGPTLDQRRNAIWGKRLPCVILFCPCGRLITLHFTRVIGYFAVFCWRIRSCARQRLGVIFNFLTNNFADNMSALKNFDVTFPMITNES